jgi:hypothetical protein
MGVRKIELCLRILRGCPMGVVRRTWSYLTLEGLGSGRKMVCHSQFDCTVYSVMMGFEQPIPSPRSQYSLNDGSDAFFRNDLTLSNDVLTPLGQKRPENCCYWATL